MNLAFALERPVQRKGHLRNLNVRDTVMNKLLWMTVITATAFGAAGAFAEPSAPDAAPVPGMQCPAGGPRMDGCGPMGHGPMGPSGTDACGRNGPGPHGMQFMNPPRDSVPEALKARMESVRAECREIRELWAKAVATRGEKSIEDLRKDFARDNAAAIAKMKADAKSLADDLRACREGFEPGNSPDMDDAMPGACAMPDVPPPFGKGQLRGQIENEVVARINALKEPLTVETYSTIVREVMAAHRGDFVDAFRDGPRHEMGPMAPDLARMREAMCKMRDASWMEKRQFRSELRNAMKIEDARQREEAVRKVLDKFADDSEEPTPPPAPEAPAKAK